MRWLERQWQHPTFASGLLLPLAWLYRGVVALRRYAYRRGWCRSVRMAMPVVVVGNISVGGTGKTPLVVWLSRRLETLGWKPGIVTRGYGGNARDWPQRVTPDSDPKLIGDEPLLLALRTARPVVADPDRVRAAQQLLSSGCDIIISDDGLQHYRLARDLEIAVIDGERRFGNGRLLPAGPLREPPVRLNSVDARIIHGATEPGEWGMTLTPTVYHRVNDPTITAALATFHGKEVHAVAGIGHPPRFFALLRTLGVNPMEHAFPDHHRFSASDLAFPPAHIVIMTEKDAVKCQDFAGDSVWYLSVDARVDPRFDQWLQQRLREMYG
ncbi:MAG: tetraacyldisaccharide 4'-kinase [Gammaproteobacteria bacterium]|nr:tetraacyldisaccharide 4'-kinase [Gammaproteobacteria bacterium]